jgi:uncharacterized protein (TIGR03437 family)
MKQTPAPTAHGRQFPPQRANLHGAGRLLVSAALLALPVMAQTTTNFNATFAVGPIGGAQRNFETFQRTYMGSGSVGSLGNALVQLNLTQGLGNNFYNPANLPLNVGFGPLTVELTLSFNRLDRITLSFQNIQDSAPANATTAGRVSGGTGAYAGASTSGGMSLTLTTTTPLNAGRYSVSLTGSVTLGGRTLNLAMTNVAVVRAATAVTVFDTGTGTCSMPPLGSGTATVRVIPYPLKWDDNVRSVEVNLTCALSATDSIQGFIVATLGSTGGQVTFASSPFTITGGTGRFAGAFGISRETNVISTPDDKVTLTTSGTITESGPATPIITSVSTASSPLAGVISQNTWIEIKGTNLVPASTPAGGTFWSNAPEFAQGRMPTEIGGVSVTVNGKPAYVWWFCSKATTPSCATDQINVLTPLDDYQGQVLVVVKNGAVSSGAFLTNLRPINPSVLVFSARGDAVATHADGSLVGPASLFPGASTPARRGETISLWAVGFGLPSTPLVAGSSTQSGSLQGVLCSLDESSVAVQAAAALVSPGLTQLNVRIPDNATVGDQHFFCIYANRATQSALSALIAVQ